MLYPFCTPVEFLSLINISQHMNIGRPLLTANWNNFVHPFKFEDYSADIVIAEIYLFTLYKVGFFVIGYMCNLPVI